MWFPWRWSGDGGHWGAGGGTGQAQLGLLQDNSVRHSQKALMIRLWISVQHYVDTATPAEASQIPGLTSLSQQTVCLKDNFDEDICNETCGRQPRLSYRKLRKQKQPE